MKQIFKGNFIFTPHYDEWKYFSGYIIVTNGIISNLVEHLGENYRNIKITDFEDYLIIPSFTDLHNHIADYAIKGLGLNTNLETWYLYYGQKVNERFKDLKYAKKHYENFLQYLISNGITHSVLFNVLNFESNLLFLELLKSTKLKTYVGKLNFNQNMPLDLLITDDQLIKEQEQLINQGAWTDSIKPIITIDMVNNCTMDLIESLSSIANKFNLPIQTHLSETRNDQSWVQQHYPLLQNPIDVYQNAGVLKTPTILAHCNYSSFEELNIIKKYQAFIAHCPVASINYWIGLANLKLLLKLNINVGLGSDGAGSPLRGMLDVIVQTIYASRLRSLDSNDDSFMVSLTNSFYLATKGGGAFFGKVGSFEIGFEFNALVLDDSSLSNLDINPLTWLQRCERFIYYGTSEQIIACYIMGQKC